MLLGGAKNAPNHKARPSDKEPLWTSVWVGPPPLWAWRTRSFHSTRPCSHCRHLALFETSVCLSVCGHLWPGLHTWCLLCSLLLAVNSPCMGLYWPIGEVAPNKPGIVGKHQQVWVPPFGDAPLPRTLHFARSWTSFVSRLSHGMMMKIKIWNMVLRLKYQHKTSTSKLVRKRIPDSGMASSKAQKKENVLLL